MTKRVAIITTVQHNPGDDFVREGIVHLLRQVIGDFQPSLIHKHLPITARPGLDWFHLRGVGSKLDAIRPLFALRLSKIVDRIPLNQATDKVVNADVLVQSGAPIYWTGSDGDCQENEWWDPLVERRWMQQPNRGIFLNIAGGTCQHFHSDGSEFRSKPAVLDYIRRFHDLADVTTVRDRLSLEVLRHAGRNAPVLPCTSVFAVDQLRIQPREGSFVALNFMSGGGHFDFGQPIDFAAWERRFVSFAGKLAQRERCMLICHDAKEVSSAQRLLPQIPIFFAEEYRAYLECYARAKYGIFNRVHGAFALASLGKPAVIIGADSRARMAEMLGMECKFVNDATTDWLESQPNNLANRAPSYPAEIQERKSTAERSYISELARVFAAKE
jgi:hypothetical protein